MTITSILTIDGVVRTTDILDIQITKSLSSDNASGVFSILVENRNGRNTDTYSIGQDVIINLNGDNIFKGTIEKVDVGGAGLNNSVILTGRDFTTILMDETVQPEVYTNKEASFIIKDLLDKYTTGITYNNVDTTTVVFTRITFNQISVFDAIKNIAEQSQSVFWIDGDKDVHFVLKTNLTDSGIILDKTNVLNTKIKTDRKEVYNKVWIYGGRVLSGWTNSFTADGTGSVFSLESKPHNPEVKINSVLKYGAVEQSTVSSFESGTQYFVNFDDAQIVFVSGTVPGDNIPANNDTIVVNYDRSLPIIKFGQDNVSIAKYGPKTRVISNENITDPSEASTLLARTLEQQSTPQIDGDIFVNGFFSIEVGQKLTVNLPKDGVDNKLYEAIALTYNISKETLLNERVITFRLNKRNRDITDTIKFLAESIRRIEARNIDTTDIFTRLEFSSGSFGIRQRYSIAYQQDIGSSFILGHPINGRIGSVNNIQPVLGFDTAGTKIRQRVSWGDNNITSLYSDTIFSGTSTGTWDTTNKSAVITTPSSHVTSVQLFIGSNEGITSVTFEGSGTTGLTYQISPNGGSEFQEVANPGSLTFTGDSLVFGTSLFGDNFGNLQSGTNLVFRVLGESPGSLTNTHKLHYEIGG